VKDKQKQETKVKNKTKDAKKGFIENKTFFVVSLIIAVIIAFCLYKVVIFIQNPADTFSVEQGKIYEEERAVGYIIREETVVKGSNYKNGMEQIKSEGEKAAKGEAIFRYYSSGEDNLVKKIGDLDIKIEEAIKKQENPIYSSDIKALDRKIEEDLVILQKANNMQTIQEIKKEIDSNITKKAKIAGEKSPAGSYLKKLIDERKEYENQLNKGVEQLKAPISGVVSYKIDGYEEILTPNNLNNLKIQTLEELNIKTGQVVADSKEGAKIINNFECYIACCLNEEQAKEAELGKTVKIRLPNDAEISSKIIHVSKEENKVLVVFQIDRQVQSLMSYRKISFDIIWWSDSGKKVPNEAIGTENRGENELNYVVRTRGGYEDKIFVKIKRKNEKYAIIENYTRTELQELGISNEEINNMKVLTLYDEILKKPT
jgi:putative membrane fusion protein